MARYIGMSTQIISRYERNEIIPQEEILNKLGQFYGVSIEDITEENR
ncbi:helix-turn-helix domain-containing protein [Cytobacillus firmus]